MKNDIAKDRHIIDTPLNRPKKNPPNYRANFAFLKSTKICYLFYRLYFENLC